MRMKFSRSVCMLDLPCRLPCRLLWSSLLHTAAFSEPRKTSDRPDRQELSFGFQLGSPTRLKTIKKLMKASTRGQLTAETATHICTFWP